MRIDVPGKGVLVDNAIDVVKFTAAFKIAVAQTACLQVLISFDQANLPAGVDTAAGFSQFDSICQQAPAVEASFYIAGGNKPA
ncbi:hypothetical protein KBZ17_05590 [Cyanobium sp. A2C-AMD]|nr:hypothetical protein [Cyanobium sp. A2C-AMD]